MGGVKKLLSVRFRHTMGPIDLVQPKGSTLLQVHQSGSGYWFADLLCPETDEEEPLRLLVVSMKDTNARIEAGWECVGHASTHGGRRVYVFHDKPVRKVSKVGRPKKAATPPPVDDAAK
jgi:hypothetical protein